MAIARRSASLRAGNGRRRDLEVLAIPVGILLVLFLLAITTTIWPGALQP
jgi:hypothetical protein